MNTLMILCSQHIDLWVEYMMHFRRDDANWAMVTGYFVQLLLQDSIPIWYANGDKYNISWADVEQVFMPINEGEKHWLLARFEIRKGIVTFYDSGYQEDKPPGSKDVQEEQRPWYVNMRACLQVNNFSIVINY